MWQVETRVSARTGAAWRAMSVETTAPCSSRRWGEDEEVEVEGQSSDAAPIAMHGHRPTPRDGGGSKEEASAGRGGEARRRGRERRVAGQLRE